MNYKKIKIPRYGEKIRYVDGKIEIPDNPIIPFIEGDGIGPDIWKVTQKVVDSAVEKSYNGKRKVKWVQIYAGLSALKNYGKDNVLPDETIQAIRDFKIAIKGPLTTPVGRYDYVCLVCAKEQDGINGKRPDKCIKCGSEYITPRFRSLNVGLRQILDLYACVRPVRWYKGVPSPVKYPEKLDIVVFRENTEDVYAGIEFEEGSDEAVEIIEYMKDEFNEKIRFDSGIGIKPISITGTKRIVKKAINYAIEQNKPNVTLVHKGNIMKFTEGAFRDWGYEIAKNEFRDKIVTENELWDKYNGEKPDSKILIKDRIADQMFQQVLLRPDEYSVIATPNLNGDYLSDACAAQVGGLGLAPGANLGDEIALFEATHGTAPKYTDMDKVNPSSLILSAVMMMKYLNWNEAGNMIEKSLEKTISQKTVTYDLERQMKDAIKLRTSEFGDKIIKNM